MKMTKIPITQYNNHSFANLEYYPNLGILFYKNKEIPWKINKTLSYNKKTNEMKTYIYQTVVIPDTIGKKHKIFKEKFEKTYANQEPPPPAQEQEPIQKQEPPPIQEQEPKQQTQEEKDPCYDVHQQLQTLQNQRMMDEDEMIEHYIQTYNLEDGQIVEIGGRKWFFV
jgi:hypothetical protein